MDPVRKRIDRAIRDRGLTYKAVSLQLGKNHAYIQQFIERSIPAKLNEDVRARLAEMLDIPEAELGAPAGRSAREPDGDVANLVIRAGLGVGTDMRARRRNFAPAHRNLTRRADAGLLVATRPR